MFNGLKIVKKNRIEQFMAFQSRRRSRTQKNKSPNVTTVGSQTPKKFLVFFFLVINVQR
jgi:hypothetical protein